MSSIVFLERECEARPLGTLLLKRPYIIVEDIGMYVLASLFSSEASPDWRFPRLLSFLAYGTVVVQNLRATYVAYDTFLWRLLGGGK